MKLLRSWYGRLGLLVGETLKFGAVGGFGIVVNAVVFSFCLNHLHLASVRSSIISTAAAIVVNYVGNRWWAFKHRKAEDRRRELVLFLLFSGVGMAIEAGAVAVSHYWFGFTSARADAIAKFAFGLPLGTLFRFWSYRTWVFTGVAHKAATAVDMNDEAARLVREESESSRA